MGTHIVCVGVCVLAVVTFEQTGCLYPANSKKALQMSSPRVFEMVLIRKLEVILMISAF